MSNKHIIVIIPARMAASRFPGKPIAKILGLPLIEHVRRRVLLSNIVDGVYVATCDQEIKEVVEQYGGKAIMTASTHERCTERVEEAARTLDADIIVTVQGDEPLFMPEVIEGLVKPFALDSDIKCTNLISLINNRNDLSHVDIVKALINMDGDIMYFSRAPIPFYRVDNNAHCYRQTGISAFTKEFLTKFVNLPPTPLEIAESIDFLRILEYGYKIRSVVIAQPTFGVDREEHIKQIEEMINSDPVQRQYYERISSV